MPVWLAVASVQIIFDVFPSEPNRYIQTPLGSLVPCRVQDDVRTVCGLAAKLQVPEQKAVQVKT